LWEIITVKRIIVLLLVLVAISLLIQGCSKPEAEENVEASAEVEQANLEIVEYPEGARVLADSTVWAWESYVELPSAFLNGNVLYEAHDDAEYMIFYHITQDPKFAADPNVAYPVIFQIINVNTADLLPDDINLASTGETSCMIYRPNTSLPYSDVNSADYREFENLLFYSEEIADSYFLNEEIYSDQDMGGNQDSDTEQTSGEDIEVVEYPEGVRVAKDSTIWAWESYVELPSAFLNSNVLYEAHDDAEYMIFYHITKDPKYSVNPNVAYPAICQIIETSSADMRPEDIMLVDKGAGLYTVCRPCNYIPYDDVNSIDYIEFEMLRSYVEEIADSYFMNEEIYSEQEPGETYERLEYPEGVNVLVDSTVWAWESYIELPSEYLNNNVLYETYENEEFMIFYHMTQDARYASDPDVAYPVIFTISQMNAANMSSTDVELARLDEDVYMVFSPCTENPYDDSGTFDYSEFELLCSYAQSIIDSYFMNEELLYNE